MKLSDLILICKAVKEDHGDLDVVFYTESSPKPVEHASVERIVSKMGWNDPVTISDKQYLVLKDES